MTTYPIVKIPQALIDISKATLPLPEPPVEPIKPVEPTAPTSPKKDETSVFGSGCLSIPIVGIGLFFLFVASHSRENTLGNMIGFGCIMTGIIMWIKSFSNDSSESESKYKIAQTKYSKDIHEYRERRERYFKSVVEYPKIYKHYQEAIALYNSEINYFTNSIEYDTALYKYKEKLLIQALKEATKPSTYTNKSVRKGASEDYFYQIISTELKDYDLHILRNKTIQNQSIKNPYIPDLLVSIEPINQNIIIEIDEPYIGSTGEPIHYIGSNDSHRDNFFLQNGWSIIPLTEEQIVKHPYGCIKYILETLDNYTTSSESSLALYMFGISSDNVDITPQWTKEQAHRMAFDRYRHSYLPTDLAGYIKEEIYNPVDSNSTYAKRTLFTKAFELEDDNDLPF